ncbi:MAG: signal recognition particle-docking protein FtsY [Syntrophobacteraceae bacterium]
MIKWFKRKRKQGPEPEPTDQAREEETREEVTAEEERAAETGGAPAEAVEEAELPPEEPEEPEEPGEPQEPEGLVEGERPVAEEPEDLVQGERPVAEEPGPEAVVDEEAGFWADAGVEDEGESEGPEVRKTGFFKRLRARLHKTREKFVHRIDRLVLGRKEIDEDLLDELEEILITSDLGVKTTEMLLRKVADKVKRKELSDPAKLREQIRDEVRSVLSVDAPPLDYRADRPFVVMIIGVNGVGKTTTIGKLAHQLKRQDLRTMLVAGDTFRAAAVEQLSIWGERVGVPVIKQKSGSDPSAVVYDAIDAAVARDVDVMLLDTAGRMHTKVNLMEELKKIQRVVNKKMPAAPHEVFLVLDASTGQNALSQARLFKEGIGVTGLILTKLDGTAKGGIVAAICDELKLPVRYIGIGESLDDLRPFDADEFTKALF